MGDKVCSLTSLRLDGDLIKRLSVVESEDRAAAPVRHAKEPSGGNDMVSRRATSVIKDTAKPKRRSAYISAPYSVDTNLILQILQERGLETIRLDEMGVGQSI